MSSRHEQSRKITIFPVDEPTSRGEYTGFRFEIEPGVGNIVGRGALADLTRYATRNDDALRTIVVDPTHDGPEVTLGGVYVGNKPRKGEDPNFATVSEVEPSIQKAFSIVCGHDNFVVRYEVPEHATAAEEQ